MTKLYFYLTARSKRAYTQGGECVNGKVCAEGYADGFRELERRKHPKLAKLFDRNWVRQVNSLGFSTADPRLRGTGSVCVVNVSGFRPITPIELTDFASNVDKRGYWHWLKTAPSTFIYSLGHGKGEGEKGDFTVEERSLLIPLGGKELEKMQECRTGLWIMLNSAPIRKGW